MAFNLGDVFVTFKAKTQDFKRGLDDAQKGLQGLSARAKAGFDKLATTGKRAWQGLALVAGAALAFISSRIGSAIKRIDTLINFPKVLTSMGSTAEEAKTATDRLSKSLMGLPTPLQDGAAGVQSLVAAGLAVPRATDAFLAMNNALIAGGANAQDTQIVMDSLTRSISAGEADVSTLQAAMSRMPTVLQALSKESGLSADALFKLYSKDPQKLIDDMVRLNKEGTGSIKSLEQQARDATGGIGTSFENMKNAIDRSWQAVVEAIGGGDLEAGQKKIAGFISDVGKKFESTTKTIVKFAKENKSWLAPLAAVLGAVAVGIVAIAMAAAAISFIASPVALIGGAIVGLVAGLVLLNEKFGFINQAIEFMKPILEDLARFLTDVFISSWNGLKKVFDFLWPSIVSLGQTFVKDLLPALKQIWDAVVRLWNALNPGLMFAVKVIAAILGALLIGAIWLVINGIKVGIAILAGLVSAISNVIKWVANFIGWLGNIPGAAVRAYRAVADWFGKIPGWIGGVVDKVVKWFSDLPGRIGNTIGGVKDKIMSPFKSAFNAIAGFWNRTIGKLSFTAPDWVPGIGGKGWSMPTLPTLALGTPNWQGGMAVLGEHGREAAFLPRGTVVKSAQETEAMGGQGGDNYYINLKGVMARTDSELADVAEQMIKALDRRRMANGKPQILGGQA